MKEQVIMRILREAKGYSQDYVASRLNINQNTYSKLESGQSKLTVERMKKLAGIYDVPANLFLSDQLPVVNYNTGTYSRSVIQPNSYKEVDNKDLYERIIADKEKQIDFLTKELELSRQDRESLRDIINKLKVNMSVHS